jgi:hypothetical protein
VISRPGAIVHGPGPRRSVDTPRRRLFRAQAGDFCCRFRENRHSWPLKGRGCEAAPRFLAAEVAIAPDLMITTLEQRSRTAILLRFPELFDLLPPSPAACPTFPEGQAPDGLAVAAAAVEAYFQKPARIVLAEPYGENLYSAAGRAFGDSFIAACRELGATPGTLAREPAYRGGMLIVFGVGLGFHLDPLIERTGAGQVVIVESDLALLGAALATQDWQRLFEHHEGQGRRFTLITAASAPEIAEGLLAGIARSGEVFLDGAWLFVQPPYPRALFEAVRARILEGYRPLLIVQGNYRDECLMIVNTFANLRRNPLGLIDAGRQPARPEPVFIIGSGPSLDDDIAEIRRLRERCLVFSCGSALQACLGHGIRPDFHVELENHELIVDILSHAARGHGLAGITLVASLTIDPRVPPMFERALMYFRHRTVPACLFGARTYEMAFAAPTVTNVAVRVAISFGFTNFFLFGTDLGTRRTDRIHADHTAYRDLPEVGEIEKSFDFALEVPGNFGGTVKTDRTFFDPARRNIETLIAVSGVTVRNCSDGVRIAGARPQKARSLRLPPLPAPAPVVRDRIVACYPRLEPGQGFARIDPERVLRERERFFDGLAALIHEAGQDDAAGIIDFWTGLLPFCDGDGDAYAGVTLLCSRELRSATRFAAFFITRVGDAGVRRALFRRFLEALGQLVAAIREHSAPAFEGLIPGAAGHR